MTANYDTLTSLSQHRPILTDVAVSAQGLVSENCYQGSMDTAQERQQMSTKGKSPLNSILPQPNVPLKGVMVFGCPEWSMTT